MSYRILVIAITVAGTALSQEIAQELGDLAPDRPGFGESTGVVGRLVTQVEGGFAVNRVGQDVDYALPQTLLRFGISRRVELRFGGAGYVLHTALDNSFRTFGRSDHAAGVKFKFRDERKLWPALSLIANLSIPVGNAQFTSGAVDPEIKLGWSKNLPKAFSVSGTFNFSSVSGSQGRLFNRAFGVSAGRRLGMGFSGSWEVYRVNLERGRGASWMAASGLTHGLGKNAQLDLSGGHTVSGASSGWFLGAGFVFRQPTWKLFRGAL